ncbi:hypothetical protein ON010_g15948 [Phytophthora cinnamomi]|nr:hypothetical protein ON010_g15948 [Phytophthora cinnamomi]
MDAGVIASSKASCKKKQLRWVYDKLREPVPLINTQSDSAQRKDTIKTVSGMPESAIWAHGQARQRGELERRTQRQRRRGQSSTCNRHL